MSGKSARRASRRGVRHSPVDAGQSLDRQRCRTGAGPTSMAKPANGPRWMSTGRLIWHRTIRRAAADARTPGPDRICMRSPVCDHRTGEMHAHADERMSCFCIRRACSHRVNNRANDISQSSRKSIASCNTLFISGARQPWDRLATMLLVWPGCYRAAYENRQAIGTTLMRRPVFDESNYVSVSGESQKKDHSQCGNKAYGNECSCQIYKNPQSLTHCWQGRNGYKCQ